MVNGVTKTGFAFSLDESCMNDMELLDILADDSVDDAFRVSRIVKKNPSSGPAEGPLRPPSC